MRIMGLDYGSKTVGVAVSDPLGYTAQALETITREEENKLRQTYRRLEELIAQRGITTVVLGYPKNMDNTEGERCQKTKIFQKQLQSILQHHHQLIIQPIPTQRNPRHKPVIFPRRRLRTGTYW